MNIRKPDKTELPALQKLWQESFGDTKEFVQTFFKTAFDYNRCFCVVEKGIAVAALYWFDCAYYDRPVAYLYAISTAKAYQGQGICHNLMMHTHRHLQNLGYAGTILVPGSSTLFCFYENMGYKTCCYVREFHCTTKTFLPTADSEAILTKLPTSVVAEPVQPPYRHSDVFPMSETAHDFLHRNKTLGAPFRLRPVTKTEYATLRKQLLPKDGIIQENICLDFLQTQARLYAGPHFIMAAHVEENRLFVPELLGDTSTAPQILHSLGCEKGIFRTFGTQKPFAMYHALQESDLPLPTYLGLAFD